MMSVGAIINAVKDEKWCQVLTVLMRLTVGGLFAFSGFVKAIDPWGTCYKVTDYLTAMGLEQWTSMALFVSVCLAAIEFMTGIFIIVGAYRRSAPVIALLLMLVMTPLTLWLAVTDAVPDCGCFGDALHLSNWATFGKNLLLTLGIIYLMLFNKSVRGIYGPVVHWVVGALSFALVMAVAYYGYFTQPLIDYRPYPVGMRLVASDVDQDDQEAGEDDFIFIYSKNGEEHEFSIDSLPDEEDGWEYVTRYHARRPNGKVIVQNGSTPSSIAIMDEDGMDVTLEVLTESRQTLLLLFPDLPEVGVADSYPLNEMHDAGVTSDVNIIGLTSATDKEIAEWKDISMASYPIYSMDDSELKMVARGNPAIVYLQDGVVMWKRALTSLTDIDQPIELSEMGKEFDGEGILTRLMLAFVVSLAALLVLNRSHLAIKHLFFKRKDTSTRI